MRLSSSPSQAQCSQAVKLHEVDLLVALGNTNRYQYCHMAKWPGRILLCISSTYRHVASECLFSENLFPRDHVLISKGG